MNYRHDDGSIGSTDEHAALDRFGAAAYHFGGEPMTASERFATLPGDARDCIVNDMADSAPRWGGNGGNHAPREWFAGWGESA